MLTAALSRTKSKSRRVPMASAMSMRPRRIRLRAPVTTPRSISAMPRVHQQRVQRQIAVITERLQHRLGNRAHPDLDGGAVGHQRGDVAADGALDVADDRRRILDQRLVDLHAQRRSGSACSHAVAARARHARIDLGDDERGPRAAGSARLDRDARGSGSRAASGGAVCISTQSGAQAPPAENAATASKYRIGKNSTRPRRRASSRRGDMCHMA